jgi:hypothetical protein
MELFEVVLELREQRPREHVAQQEDDADDFVRFDAARNDALRQIARIRLQRFERSRLERFDVVVVYGRRFGEDFFLRHRREQLRLCNAPCPFLTELRSLLAKVRDQLSKKCRGVFSWWRGRGRSRRGQIFFHGQCT